MITVSVVAPPGATLVSPSEPVVVTAICVRVALTLFEQTFGTVVAPGGVASVIVVVSNAGAGSVRVKVDPVTVPGAQRNCTLRPGGMLAVISAELLVALGGRTTCAPAVLGMSAIRAASPATKPSRFLRVMYAAVPRGLAVLRSLIILSL